MVAQGQEVTQAVSIPVIGDGDNGYGNAMNVKRTVKGYIRAGFGGIILEDQVCVCQASLYYMLAHSFSSLTTLYYVFHFLISSSSNGVNIFVFLS